MYIVTKAKLSVESSQREKKNLDEGEGGIGNIRPHIYEKII